MPEGRGGEMRKRGRELRGLQGRQSGVHGPKAGGLQQGEEDQFWEDRRLRVHGESHP